MKFGVNLCAMFQQPVVVNNAFDAGARFDKTSAPSIPVSYYESMKKVQTLTLADKTKRKFRVFVLRWRFLRIVLDNFQ